MSPCFAIILAVLAQQPIPKGAVPRMLPRVAPAAMPPVAPPTAPTPIVLDFKNQTAPMIALGLSQRTGGLIAMQGMGEPTGNEKRFTLEAPAPVPFWEALDRFSDETHYLRFVNSYANVRPQIMIHGPGTSGYDYGPAAYIGPFRLGPVVVHENFDLVFLKPKLPPNWIVETPPTFFADMSLLGELNLISIRTGPLRKLEAIDELGQSLLDPKLKGEGPPLGPFQYADQEPKMLRVPLVRPTKPSKTLATLRGVVPIEVGRKPYESSTVIPLEGSSGKTFVDGDIALTVREFKPGGTGPTLLKLSVRIEGKRGRLDPDQKGLLGTRFYMIYNHLIDIVDARGNSVGLNSGGDPFNGEFMNRNYSYVPHPAGMPPVQVRIYRPDWADWDMPFEFKNLTLP